MDPDFLMVFGFLIAACAIPAVINYFSTSGRTLRPATILVLVGGGMMVAALIMNPSGYAIEDLPRIAWDVFGDLLR